MNSDDVPAGPVLQIGVCSAYATCACSVAFTAASVLTEAGMLRPPWNLLLPIVPSLLLAPAFLVMMVCVNAIAPAFQRIWSQIGVALTIVYVPLVSAAYIVELFVVEPRMLRGFGAETSLLTLTRSDSVLNAIDGLGYLMMCFATLASANAFGRVRRQRLLGWLFRANGILALPIFLTYFVNRAFIWAAAPWAVTVAASAFLLGGEFRAQIAAGRPGPP